jgi:MEMO1 family protein
MIKTRDPAVAGVFYPGLENELNQVVDDYLAMGAPAVEEALVVVSPHAGYIYSGAVAGETIGRVKIPRRVVILGPKHRAGGLAAAVSGASAWTFPFGQVPVDKEFSEALVRETIVEFDDVAHRLEHSLEVQVPFLVRSNSDTKITALALGFLEPGELREIGAGLARTIEKSSEPVLIVASTDMSHHIPADTAARLDQEAIARVVALDPDGLLETVFKNQISMCGVVPTAVALHAAKALGATESKLVRYSNSGQVSGDYSAVVGYAGMVIK